MQEQKTNHPPEKTKAAPNHKRQKKDEDVQHNDHESTREDTPSSPRCSGVEQAGQSCEATHGRMVDDASKVN